MPHFRIRFINGSGFVSEAIDWVTNSLWSHTEIITDTTYIGAHAGKGIQARPRDYCDPTRERRYAIPCTETQLDGIMTFAHSKIGTPYNYMDIAGLLFRDRRMNSLSREICSQFVFEAAWKGGIEMLNVLPGYGHLVTPESLHLSSLLIGNCYYEKG